MRARLPAALMVVLGAAFACARTSRITREDAGLSTSDSGTDGSAREPRPRGGSMAMGFEHTCAIGSEGAVFCLGGATYAQLGNGDTGPFAGASPVRVKQLSGVVRITAGGNHTCALVGSGEVSCWGQGSYGALGSGSESAQTLPRSVTGLGPIVQVTAGNDHTCALRPDGMLFCWGEGKHGQMGDDAAKIFNLTPLEVKGLPKVVDVSAGASHTCALTEASEVYCWGAGTHGQLGSGSAEGSFVPRKVVGLTEVAQISAARSHTCARMRSGAVRCWGEGSRGELGTGKRDRALSPVPVLGVDAATFVAAGEGQSCVIAKDKSLSCWGEGERGGAEVYPPDRLVPHRMAGLVDVEEVRLMTSFRLQGPDACVRTTTQEVHCWSSRGYGDSRGDSPGYRAKMRTPAKIPIP